MKFHLIFENVFCCFECFIFREVVFSIGKKIRLYDHVSIEIELTSAIKKEKNFNFK